MEHLQLQHSHLGGDVIISMLPNLPGGTKRVCQSEDEAREPDAGIGTVFTVCN